MSGAEVELHSTASALQLLSVRKVPPLSSLLQYLKLARELRVRDSESVAKYGMQIIQHYKEQISEDELWQVYEQVAVAALDTHNMKPAAQCINAIAKRFPESIRARRLQGMYFEALTTDSTDKAYEIYQSILKEQPADDITMKRLVALEKTRGNYTAAIEALQKYLDIFCNDSPAWEELAELYLEVLAYRQAAFCYEELLTHNPQSMNYHIRHADVLYTIGGQNNCKTARTGYGHALTLSGGTSLRCLYGIISCTALLGDKDKVANDLPALAVKALLKQYQESAPDKLPLVETLLSKQGLV